MPWFKVDDSLAFHAKTVAAGNAAMGLWVRAGAWCSQQGTNGEVPRHMVGTLGGTTAHAGRLVSAGLWTPIDSGYQFHDWLHYQPSAAEVAADRKAKHEVKVAAGKLGGIASGVARRKQARSRSEADAEQNEAPTRPGPSRGSSNLGEEVEVDVPHGSDHFAEPPSTPEEEEAAAATILSSVEDWPEADPDELAELRRRRGAA